MKTGTVADCLGMSISELAELHDSLLREWAMRLNVIPDKASHLSSANFSLLDGTDKARRIWDAVNSTIPTRRIFVLQNYQLLTQAFDHACVTAFAKTANGLAPKSWGIICEEMITWIAKPTLELIEQRMHRGFWSRRPGGQPFWVKADAARSYNGGLAFEVTREVLREEMDALGMGHLLGAPADAPTPVPFIYFDSTTPIRAGRPKRKAAEPPPPPSTHCGCGASLVHTKAFNAGTHPGQLKCADCFIKENPNDPLVHLNLSIKSKPAFPERMTKKQRDAKFDPRPGIDDQGLGFSSPTWED